MIMVKHLMTYFPPQRILQVVALPVEAPELLVLGAGAALGAVGGQDGVLGGEGRQSEPRLVWGQGESLRQVLDGEQRKSFRLRGCIRGVKCKMKMLTMGCRVVKSQDKWMNHSSVSK